MNPGEPLRRISSEEGFILPAQMDPRSSPIDRDPERSVELMGIGARLSPATTTEVVVSNAAVIGSATRNEGFLNTLGRHLCNFVFNVSPDKIKTAFAHLKPSLRSWSGVWDILKGGGKVICLIIGGGLIAGGKLLSVAMNLGIVGLVIGLSIFGGPLGAFLGISIGAILGLSGFGTFLGGAGGAAGSLFTQLAVGDASSFEEFKKQFKYDVHECGWAWERLITTSRDLWREATTIEQLWEADHCRPRGS